MYYHDYFRFDLVLTLEGKQKWDFGLSSCWIVEGLIQPCPAFLFASKIFRAPLVLTSCSSRKAFERSHAKGKKKELSPQDAALLIQMSYRAHLAHRSQVLRCLRDLAVAKAKLKEIRSFYNITYRRRIAHDSQERQRFAEKIIVLLLTVDALEVNSSPVLCYFRNKC